MFFVVRSNDSFNFPLGLIKYIVVVIAVRFEDYFATSSGRTTRKGKPRVEFISFQFSSVQFS